MPHQHHKRKESVAEKEEDKKGSEVVPAATAADGSSKQETTDSTVVASIFGALVSWGLDEKMDDVYEGSVGLVRPSAGLVFGVRGANGCLSILAPTYDDHGESGWRVSSTLTATRLLSIMALTRAVLSMKGLEEQAIIILTHHGVELPTLIGKDYAFPSFSFLAKYWQDPVGDVQQAARSIFTATLEKMSTEEKIGIVNYWRPYLPAATSGHQKTSKMNLRATIILGIIGADQPKLLTLKDCKDVAESLDFLLKENLPAAYRIAAIELMGRGFSSWEPHINSSAILRQLISATGLGTPTPAPPSAGSSPSTPPNHGTQTTQQQQQQPSVLTPAMIVMARQAIVQIASVNTSLFVGTVTFDLMHSRSAGERASGLKLLGMFIAKKPLVLYPHLHRIVESMVKCLDPNLPQIRDSLQQIVTVNFAELVKMYPNVAFHHGLQRLAVGTVESVCVVWDLRTATKVQVLEGHKKPVTAVSFSPDGKLIATFSLEENCVQLWQPSSGFLGSLVGAFGVVGGGGAGAGAGGGGSGGVSSALAGVGGGHMKSFRTFSVGGVEANVPLSTVLEQVKFEWTSDRAVKLKSIKGLELVFTV
ncbi:hypothetical protein HK104_004935 [Borealophlyctis nickersoniae]|nr:hypothetical protein HK104_004935 [Borealophlyctis nickersoniae]